MTATTTIIERIVSLGRRSRMVAASVSDVGMS